MFRQIVPAQQQKQDSLLPASGGILTPFEFQCLNTMVLSQKDEIQKLLVKIGNFLPCQCFPCFRPEKLSEIICRTFFQSGYCILRRLEISATGTDGSTQTSESAFTVKSGNRTHPSRTAKLILQRFGLIFIMQSLSVLVCFWEMVQNHIPTRHRNTEVPFPFLEFSIRLPVWQTANTPNSQKNGTADIQRITIPSTLKRCMAKWHFLNNLSPGCGICNC